MTLGLSRDDAGRFLPDYVKSEKEGGKAIFAIDPFVSIDQAGVGKLIKMAIQLGRSTRKNLKVGICGEHGGESRSVKFCHAVGMNYVSCSPFRVPIARLAAAQAVIEDKAAAKAALASKAKKAVAAKAAEAPKVKPAGKAKPVAAESKAKVAPKAKKVASAKVPVASKAKPAAKKSPAESKAPVAAKKRGRPAKNAATAVPAKSPAKVTVKKAPAKAVEVKAKRGRKPAAETQAQAKKAAKAAKAVKADKATAKAPVQVKRSVGRPKGSTKKAK
jgi:hypothetical protein